MEKDEVLNDFFPLVFNGKGYNYSIHVAEGKETDWDNKDQSTVREDQVQSHLMNWNVHRSIGPDGIHP